MQTLLQGIKEKLQRFMAGRYGTDRLCLAATALAFVLTLLGRIVDSVIPLLPAVVILALAIWRAFSKDIPRRARENDEYMRRTARLRKWLTGWLQRRKQSRQYRFFTCPGCKNHLRVPRGKGNVQITCPRCGRGFSGRT